MSTALAKRGLYVRSWDIDIPAILLLHSSCLNDIIWVEIGNNVFDLSRVLLWLDVLGLPPEEYALLFYLGGGDNTFSTKGISQPKCLTGCRRHFCSPTLKLSVSGNDADFSL